MEKPITLVTERLILRPWKDDDYASFFEMSMDPRVYEFLPPFKDRKHCDAFVDKLRNDFDRRGWGFWVLEQKNDALFAGIAGLHEPGPEFGVGRPCVEIGWRLAPALWGHGLATEAARAVLHFAFTSLNLAEVVSFTAVQNRRSESIMKRLHMSLEREFDLLLLPEGHPHRRHVLYAISNSQWKESSSQRTVTE